MSEEIWARGTGAPLSLADALEFLDKYRELANRYGRELNEARQQIAAYQVRVDNDALRMDPARVEIAADLLRDMAKARAREANLAHPLTADRFSQVLDAD